MWMLHTAQLTCCVVRIRVPIGRWLNQLWHVIGVVAPRDKCGSYPITHGCGCGRNGTSRNGQGRGVFDIRVSGSWAGLRPEPVISDSWQSCTITLNRTGRIKEGHSSTAFWFRTEYQGDNNMCLVLERNRRARLTWRWMKLGSLS